MASVTTPGACDDIIIARHNFDCRLIRLQMRQPPLVPARKSEVQKIRLVQNIPSILPTNSLGISQIEHPGNNFLQRKKETCRTASSSSKLPASTPQRDVETRALGTISSQFAGKSQEPLPSPIWSTTKRTAKIFLADERSNTETASKALPEPDFHEANQYEFPVAEISSATKLYRKGGMKRVVDTNQQSSRRWANPAATGTLVNASRKVVNSVQPTFVPAVTSFPAVAVQMGPPRVLSTKTMQTHVSTFRNAFSPPEMPRMSQDRTLMNSERSTPYINSSSRKDSRSRLEFQQLIDEIRKASNQQQGPTTSTPVDAFHTSQAYLDYCRTAVENLQHLLRKMNNSQLVRKASVIPNAELMHPAAEVLRDIERHDRTFLRSMQHVVTEWELKRGQQLKELSLMLQNGSNTAP